MPFLPPPIDVAQRFASVFGQWIPPAVFVLQQFPATQLTSWWRSKPENERVGGNPNSQHRVGWAFDAVPAPGQWDALEDALRRHRFEVIRESDHLHVQVFKAGILELLRIEV